MSNLFVSLVLECFEKKTFIFYKTDSVLGYSNQAPPAQLYSGDQTVISGPSNQPVQLVAFLPASPMMQSSNHAQAAPPPPPPPPQPTFAGQVISYPQATQTQQPQPSFTSETYTLPPVSNADYS